MNPYRPSLPLAVQCIRGRHPFLAKRMTTTHWQFVNNGLSQKEFHGGTAMKLSGDLLGLGLFFDLGKFGIRNKRKRRFLCWHRSGLGLGFFGLVSVGVDN